MQVEHTCMSFKLKFLSNKVVVVPMLLHVILTVIGNAFTAGWYNHVHCRQIIQKNKYILLNVFNVLLDFDLPVYSGYFSANRCQFMTLKLTADLNRR